MNSKELDEIMSLESRLKLDLDKSIDQLVKKIQAYDNAFFNLEALQTSTEITLGRFNFVPFPCGVFVDILTEAYDYLGHDSSKKFLDIGCGIGTKVILACSFFDAYGIEFNEKDVEKAKILGLNRVGNCDAMAFDNYAIFDVLFYYRPFFDQELYGQFESMIHQKMKPGALVAPMDTEYKWEEMPDMEKISKYLYKKIS